MKRFMRRLPISIVLLLVPLVPLLLAVETKVGKSAAPVSKVAAAAGQPAAAGDAVRPASPAPATMVAQLSGPTPQRRPDVDVEPDGTEDDADVPARFSGSIDKAEYLRLRAEYIAKLRGIFPDQPVDAEARGRAIREMEFQEAARAGASRSGLSPLKANVIPSQTWVPLGPAPIPNGQTTTVEVPVSGRVTAIAVHPSNPDIAYVGTAQGGVYRTLNGGTTWTAMMDNALSLAIGAVTIDPVDPTIVFVGTGEPNGSIDSFFGVGVYRISNADGLTPTVTGPFNSNGSADVMSGRAISRILVLPADHNTIFVSTTAGIGGIGFTQAAVLPSRGLYRSTNAQSAMTFTKLTVQPANGGNRSITDILFDPADGTGNTLVASVAGFASASITNDGGIWRTANALDPTPTFTRTLALGTSTATQRGSFGGASTGVGTSVIYAATAEGSTGRLRRSTDGGATWSATLPAGNGLCGGQCFYDIVVTVDPVNTNTLYTGGASGATILRKSTDAAVSFARMDNSLHADTHAVTLAPSNHAIVYFGSDGGVWRSNDGAATWTSLNNSTFSATQFQSLALHPTDRYFTIGGTQDNGTPFLQPANTWFRADFGDGGHSKIDQNAPDNQNVTMYHTYFNQTGNLIGFARNTLVSCAVEGQWSFKGIYGGAVDPTVHCDGSTDTFNGININDNVQFYAPMGLGPGNPNTVYFGTDKLYRSANRGDTMPAVSQFLGAFVTSIGVSPQDDNVRIVGTDRTKVFGTRTGANPLTDVTSPSFPAPVAPGTWVARAVIDPNDSNTAYITFSAFGLPAGQHVWKTTNFAAAGGTTWAASGTGIPDVPVNAFVVDPRDSRVLYAGTDIGVYRSNNSGASWSPFGTGLPRVAVFDMAIQVPNSILRIATHGRGLWEIATDNLTALSPAEVWIGLKNSDDVGTKFDLRAEIYHNGSLIGSGQTLDVPGGSSGFNNATKRTIELALTSPGVSILAGDTLAIKLLVRIAATSGHRSGTARLWFNDGAADSEFDATISGVDDDWYLRAGGGLETTPGPGPKVTKDVFVDRAVGGNPFKEFGTWTHTF